MRVQPNEMRQFVAGQLSDNRFQEIARSIQQDPETARLFDEIALRAAIPNLGEQQLEQLLDCRPDDLEPPPQLKTLFEQHASAESWQLTAEAGNEPYHLFIDASQVRVQLQPPRRPPIPVTIHRRDGRPPVFLVQRDQLPKQYKLLGVQLMRETAWPGEPPGWQVADAMAVHTDDGDFRFSAGRQGQVQVAADPQIHWHFQMARV